MKMQYHSGSLPGRLLRGRLLAMFCLLATIGGFSACRAEDGDASAGTSQLQPLEWILGEWVGVVDGGAVLVSSHWSDGGHYIVREFLLRRDDGTEVGATQRIGWDPVRKRIRSWSFDSQGGSGEGVWRQDKRRWLVDSTEVTADGQESKVSASYVPVDAEHIIWEVSDAPTSQVKAAALRIEFQRAPENE